MFKSFFFLLSAVCAAVIPIQQARAGLFQQFSEFPEENYKLAAVCFAGSGDCGSEALFSQSDQDMSIDSGSRCMSEGYQKNLCSNGQTATAICPYNKEYEKDCRCPTGLTACSEVQTGSGKSCVEDGITKYETCSCKNTLITCSDVQDGVGEECGGKYASCQCKTGLVACENNQEGVGEAKKLSDDTPVVLTGKIVRSLGSEKYEFKDKTGSVTLDIDNDDWNGVNVGPEDTVEIQGEVDKDFTSFEIDVDRVIKK